MVSLTIGMLTAVTGLISLLVITRTLSPVEYGTWGLIGGLVVYPLLAANIISYWTTRETARNIPSGKTSIVSSGIFSVLGFSIFIVIAYLIGGQTDAEKETLLFASILIPFMFLNNTLIAINYGWKPHTISYGNLIFSITNIPSTLSFVYFLNMGVEGVILANLIAHIGSILVLIIYARNKLKNPFKIEFLKKWFRLSWIPLYPALIGKIFQLDVIIFPLITGSVIGLAYWTAAHSIQILVALAAQFTKSVYPKTLHGDDPKWLDENLTQLFYFMIPFASLTIVFAKPALFALNPIYEIAVPVVIFLALHTFVKNMGGILHLFLLGGEEVDLKKDNTFKDYVKSRLVFLPTLRLIKHSVYIGLLLIGLYVLIQNTYDILDLLVYWSLMALLVEIPYTVYLYLKTKKIHTLKIDYKAISKYVITSLVAFGLTYVLMEEFLIYYNSIFDFLPHLILFLMFGSGIYLSITYIIDLRTRLFLKAIIQEIKNTTKS